MVDPGQFTLVFIVLAVMVFGLLSLLTAIIPGLVIIWVAALVYGLVTGFNLNSGILFGIITLLMLVGNVIDNIIMGTTTRQTGASWYSIGAALLAGLVGSLVWPPLGGLLAALLVVFAIEVIRLRNWRQALKSAGGVLAGCGWAVVARLGIGVIMIVLFLLWVYL
jgi:uncharacterized protein YqgC (DUF456 family)